MGIKIVKGMYGLPQAGKIAHELLKKRLTKAGYHPTQFTPGLWKHVWRPITFTLVVDNFRIKVEGNNHANHLVSTLKNYYEITAYLTVRSTIWSLSLPAVKLLYKAI